MHTCPPFEMMDALSHEAVIALITEAGLDVPACLVSGAPFYEATDTGLLVAQFDMTGTRLANAPINLPDGTIRFHLMRQCLTPIASNSAASLYEIGDDLRLIFGAFSAQGKFFHLRDIVNVFSKNFDTSAS